MNQKFLTLNTSYPSQSPSWTMITSVLPFAEIQLVIILTEKGQISTLNLYGLWHFHEISLQGNFQYGEYKKSLSAKFSGHS